MTLRPCHAKLIREPVPIYSTLGISREFIRSERLRTAIRAAPRCRPASSARCGPAKPRSARRTQANVRRRNNRPCRSWPFAPHRRSRNGFVLPRRHVAAARLSRRIAQHQPANRHTRRQLLARDHAPPRRRFLELEILVSARRRASGSRRGPPARSPSSRTTAASARNRRLYAKPQIAIGTLSSSSIYASSPCARNRTFERAASISNRSNGKRCSTTAIEKLSASLATSHNDAIPYNQTLRSTLSKTAARCLLHLVPATDPLARARCFYWFRSVLKGEANVWRLRSCRPQRGRCRPTSYSDAERSVIIVAKPPPLQETRIGPFLRNDPWIITRKILGCRHATVRRTDRLAIIRISETLTFSTHASYSCRQRGSPVFHATACECISKSKKNPSTC